jgi:hypothetical protein
VGIKREGERERERTGRYWTEEEKRCRMCREERETIRTHVELMRGNERQGEKGPERNTE